MNRGPAPAPTAILKLRGDRRVTKKVLAAEMPTVGEPKLPAGLDAAATEKWRETVDLLAPLKVFGAIDADALETYCRLWSLRRQLERTVDEDGMTRQTLDGGVAKHPAMALLLEISGIILRYQQEFGMTPSARSRVRKESTHGAADEGKANKARFFRAG